MTKETKAKKKDIDLFKDTIHTMFGKNSGILVENLSERIIEKFPTGSPKMDIRLKGGYPKGKIVEFSGDPGGGKTTNCLEGASQFQKKYPKEPILWVDLEDVYDPEYNEAIGLKIADNFILVKPDTGEQAWDIIIEFCRNVKGGLVVLDSVALLLPEKEDEGSVGDANMALAARMNSKGLRKIMPHLSRKQTTFFVINQLRSQIGGYGDPNITTGGKAWAYYARTRIKCTPLKGEEGISSKHKFKLIKANYGIKDSVIETSIIYGKGIDKEMELIDLAVEAGIIDKSGSWFSYAETKLGQGVGSVKEILMDNPELFEEIKTKLDEKIQ
jgi:recombination protein RecA